MAQIAIPKEFNITGTCIPGTHYMVDTGAQIDLIVRSYIERGKYFMINRARQYGKTTMLNLLRRRLADAYVVIDLSFEGKEDYFVSIETLAGGIRREMLRALNHEKELQAIWEPLFESEYANEELSDRITAFCTVASRGVVLMVDEVDRASDYGVFATFLGMLRRKYLERANKGTPTFQSVILAGVHDIKNLKAKIRPDSKHAYNSPWNIAAPFEIDMSFSPDGIATMLREYEGDRHTGMDVGAIAERIYYYTNGYPFLVSRLCKTIDETPLAWTASGVDAAADILIRSDNTLFDDLIKNIENNPSFSKLLANILLQGWEVPFVTDNPDIGLGAMYGILRERDRMTTVSNIVFETRIYDYFTSLSKTRGKVMPHIGERSRFVVDGRLDIGAVLDRFAAFMKSEYRDEDGTFIERQARLLFLSFLKPIINGTGHYAVEPETRGSRRMDVVVFFGGEEHIIELKIWRGEKAEAAGYGQLAAYLKSRGQSRGYLASFVDNKKAPRQGRTFEYEDCEITEVVVAYRDKE
jgi:hypothetical protein